jgi:SAM-dependent methyltransferase
MGRPTDPRSALRVSYDRMAQVRDGAASQPWKVEERGSFLLLLRQRRARTLLDLGSGPGRDGQFFQEHGLLVTCIDLAPAMVDLCRGRGLSAAVMDVADLRFPPGSFQAVYAFNSLLHIPKGELPAVLQMIDTVLAPAGLFYLGVYGGFDREGFWADDMYEPQRFFSFYTDEDLQEAVGKVFAPVSFRRIPLSEESGALHFQSMILEKREVES